MKSNRRIAAVIDESKKYPAMKEEDMKRLERTEMSMVRWMSGVSLKQQKTNDELRKRMGIRGGKGVGGDREVKMVWACGKVGGGEYGFGMQID